MSAALQTEDSVFESLFRLNRPIVYAYALSRLRNPPDAEDVTQTTFLNAYRALHRGVTPREELKWLLAIARNVCHDLFRDAKRRASEEPLDDSTPAPQPEGTDYSVSEICRQIAELHPRHRQILFMREFEGRSYGEISSELGVTQSGFGPCSFARAARCATSSNSERRSLGLVGSHSATWTAWPCATSRGRSSRDLCRCSDGATFEFDRASR